ncbi:hypothetical protein ACFV6E_21475 [Streptomyces sp. NPDC059785]|uniref:Rv1733c family protein n=1 Tax=unclassified Streptomyces TaxID=2593676 RepID=UPI00365463E0
MRTGRRVRRRFWRWRDNPLRRREDVLEAWLVLAVWVLIVVGGTLAGVWAALAADESLAHQRAVRSPHPAVLLEDVPGSAAAAGGVSGGQVRVKVRWVSPDGSVRTGLAPVDAGQKNGSTVVIWTDRQDKPVVEPPDGMAAAFESAALGTAAASALSGLALGAGAVARGWLDRRRIDQWGKHWTEIGPRWGHRTG